MDTVALLGELQSESAEHTLFTLAALDHCEQELLHALQRTCRHNSRMETAGYEFSLQ